LFVCLFLRKNYKLIQSKVQDSELQDTDLWRRGNFRTGYGANRGHTAVKLVFILGSWREIIEQEGSTDQWGLSCNQGLTLCSGSRNNHWTWLDSSPPHTLPPKIN
jgi:hypothetical protein